MSDTPRTDAIAHHGYQLDALAARAIDLCRELERESASLREVAVELAAIGRVWITVWGDQLSGDSVRRFGELEQQILKEKAQP